MVLMKFTRRGQIQGMLWGTIQIVAHAFCVGKSSLEIVVPAQFDYQSMFAPCKNHFGTQVRYAIKPFQVFFPVAAWA